MKICFGKVTCYTRVPYKTSVLVPKPKIECPGLPLRQKRGRSRTIKRRMISRPGRQKRSVQINLEFSGTLAGPIEAKSGQVGCLFGIRQQRHAYELRPSNRTFRDMNADDSRS
jgi:hypothetical protein